MQRAGGAGKFKSTMRDLSDSEDNYNAFDDSVSSVDKSPTKGETQNGANNDLSFSTEDLNDSILGGLAGSTRKLSSSVRLPSARGSSGGSSSEQGRATSQFPSESDGEDVGESAGILLLSPPFL